MSDEKMKVGIDLELKSVGEDIVDAVTRKLKNLERQIKSINATANAVAGSVTDSSSGGSSSSTRSTNDTRAARDALALDRASVAELRRKLSLQGRMASQQARQEREAFTSFKASSSFRAKADADEMHSLNEKASEEAKAFRQRMNFTTRMGRLAVSEERNATRERARSIAESTRAETRRSRDIAASIRSNARLEVTEARRVDRETSANRRALRSSGREISQHGPDAYHRLTRLPAVAAIAGGAATAALARKALGAEADIDAAEINARAYAGLSKDAARALRDSWASPLAESLGVSTAKLLKSYTDAVKLGIPNEGAKAFSELATQTSEAWSVPFETVTDTLGTVNSLLTSTGEAFSFDKLNSVANSIQYLAAKQSTTPEKLISFLQRGAGASQVLGMSQEVGLAFGSASTSLGNQAGQSGRLFDYISSRLIEMPNLVKKQGLEGQQAKQLVQALGYGSAESMNAQRRANPNAFLPDFMERFSKVRDPRKQEQMIRFFTGREWLGEFGRMVKGIETYKEASKLTREAKGLDAIGAVWELHRTKLAFVFKQFKSGWLNILGEFGKVLSPIARQVGDSFLAWSRALQGGGLRARFQAVIDGFVAGLGFKDVPAMLQGAFGTPGQGDGGAISAWKASAKAFAEGLSDIFGAVKSVISAFVVGDPEVIARWSGRILALSVALAALSPVLAVLGGLAALIQTLAAGLAGIAALKTLAGGAAVAGGGSALLMAAGGIIAAGFLAKVASAYGILKPLDSSKGLGRGIVEFLDPGLASRLFGDEKPKGDGAWVDPPAKKPIERLTDALDENAKVLKQSFESPNTGLGGLIHRAALMSGSTGMGSTISALRSGPSLSPSPGGSLGEGLPPTSGPYGNSVPGSALDGSGSRSSGIGGSRHFGAPSSAGTSFNGVTAGNTPAAQGSVRDRMKSVYDAFRSTGLSHEASKSFAAEIGRENDFNKKLLFGNHLDPHNGKRNVGMMSWQNGRDGKVLEHLKAGGHLNPDGSIKQTQEALNAQASFAVQEMKNGSLGARGQKALGILNDPNATHAQRAQTLGDDVIKWRQNDPRYASHGVKRDRYYNQMEGVSKGESSVAGIGNMGGSVLNQMQSLRTSGRVMNEQCVALAKAAVGATGSVTEWRKGEAAQFGNLKPGTPIATFLDRQGRQHERYAGGSTGTMGAKLDHAAVFEKYIKNDAGKIVGMTVAELYKGSGGVKSKNYMFGKGFGEANGSNYNAILGPDGNPLGGKNNPMSQITQRADALKSSGWKPGLGGNAPVSGGAGAALGSDVPVRVPNTTPIGGAKGGGQGGGSSSAIHAPITITGTGMDSEAVANAVQRKLSESMNRRTHDLSPTSI